MSLQHRTTSGDAGYEPISQEEADIDEARVPALVLEEDVDEALVEEFVSQEHVAEHDRRIYWIHVILGSAVLLPWNVLITATPYFLARLEGSALKSTFSSYLSTTFTAANFGFLAHATSTSNQSASSRRILLSISWLALLTFTLTISTYIHAPAGLFFTFVLGNGIAQAAAGSYLQTAVIAVASLFGPTAIQAVMTGQAAIAIAVSGVEVLSAAGSISTSGEGEAIIASEPEEKSAFVFFALSTVFLVFSAGAQVMLTRLPLYKTLMQQFHATAEHALASSQEITHNVESKKHQLIRVGKTNMIYHIAVAYVFVVTLAVFPPITISILPTNPATHPLLFSAIHFFVFNIGDFLGRYICSFPRLVIWSAKRLLTLSLARTLFIPLFLMCNIQRSSQAISSAVISSDVLYMLILLAFGLSNGYISSLCMMSAPSVEHNPRLKGRIEDVDVAATVASFCLVGGLAIGGFASFGVRAAVCNCNPFRG
ncbi:nucleoside transporter-domain-containing protein [Irpex rosettiformis]|uniref:Nucleoside transporter-domain-containing protein n=1 Tax=Irpex rosettiformis TaxID=378272 RepID=A0ACB8UDY8_9APHY|nr:nucleoside transporter-domain-containing protein [Irpex rosettiformis]